MGADITFAAALFAGLLSFLSPCVLPLVPPYLVYLAGASLERFADAEPEPRVKRDTVFAALLFVAGFSTVFVAFGASASAVGALIQAWSRELSIIAGVAIIAMGLHFLGITRFAFLMFEKRAPMSRPVGLWGAYAMGLAFAFGWTPCIGPILAAILAVAGAQETVAHGALLLAAYAFGLGVPFVLAALAMEQFLVFARGFRRQFGRLEKAVGVALVLTGVAFLTGGVQAASGWLIELFPKAGLLG